MTEEELQTVIDLLNEVEVEKYSSELSLNAAKLILQAALDTKTLTRRIIQQ